MNKYHLRMIEVALLVCMCAAFMLIGRLVGCPESSKEKAHQEFMQSFKSLDDLGANDHSMERNRPYDGQPGQIKFARLN